MPEGQPTLTGPEMAALSHPRERGDNYGAIDVKLKTASFHMKSRAQAIWLVPKVPLKKAYHVKDLL